MANLIAVDNALSINMGAGIEDGGVGNCRPSACLKLETACARYMFPYEQLDRGILNGTRELQQKSVNNGSELLAENAVHILASLTTRLKPCNIRELGADRRGRGPHRSPTLGKHRVPLNPMARIACCTFRCGYVG